MNFLKKFFQIMKVMINHGLLISLKQKKKKKEKEKMRKKIMKITKIFIQELQEMKFFLFQFF